VLLRTVSNHFGRSFLPVRAKPAEQPTKFTEVDVDKLLFDPSNPRFGGKAGKHTLTEIEASQPNIQDLLEKDPHFALRLVESFSKNGFIRYEPLVVRQVEDKFVVIEGNRRLAAVRHIIANANKFPESLIRSLKKIPVLVFHQQEDQSHIQDMRVYLGVRHLFGFKDWPAESKAVFLDEQIHSAEDLERTVGELGIKKSAVRRYLVPYRMTKMARQKLKGMTEQQFWTLGEALTRASIPEYIELQVNPDTLEVEGYNLSKLKKLTDFLYGELRDGIRDPATRKVMETRDSSSLANVLRDPRAVARLERGASLAEAELEVKTPAENLVHLREELRALAIVIRSITRGGDKKAKDLKRKYQEFSKAARQFLKANA